MPSEFSAYYSSAYHSDDFLLSRRDKSICEAEDLSRCVPYNLISFLALIADMEIDIYQVTWDGNTSPLGMGGSAVVSQTTTSGDEGIAFKRVGVKNEHADSHEQSLSTEARIFKILISEVTILTNPSIRNHPGIIDLEAICFETDFSYMVPKIVPVLMYQKAPYGDLEAFMESQNSFSYEDAMRILIDILQTVAYLHFKDLIHGDLKPKNILVFKDNDGRPLPKLADFGFSLHETDTAIKLPVSSGWSAPEIDSSYPDLTFEQAQKADVFSLGLLALWLLQHVTIPRDQDDVYMENSDCKHDQNIVIRQRKVSWTNTWKQVRKNGLRASEASQICERIACFITADQFHDLHMVLSIALAPSIGERTNDCLALLAMLEVPTPIIVPFEISSNIHGKALSLCGKFRIAPLIPLIADLDFRIRGRINELLYQLVSQNHVCSTCSQNAALQLAACVKIGFGTTRNEDECLKFLAHSGRSETDLESILHDIMESKDGIKINNSTILRLVHEGCFDIVFSSGNFRHLGDIDTSIEKLERELEAVAEFLGYTHTVSFQLCITLSDIYERRREYAKWAAMCESMIAHFNSLITVTQGPDSENPRRRRAELLFLLGKAYVKLFRIPEALEAAKRALVEWESFIDDVSLNIKTTKQLLANIYAELGQYDHSIDLIESLITSEAQLLGARGVHVQDWLKTLAEVLVEQHAYSKAEERLLEALELAKTNPASTSAQVFDIKFRLGEVYWYLGQYGASLEHLEEVKEFWKSYEDNIGQVAPEYPLVLIDLIDTLESLDRLEEALCMAEESVRLSKALSKDIHLQTISRLVNVRCAMDLFDGLEELASDVVDMSITLYGPNHPITLGCQKTFGFVLIELGRYVDAERILRQTVDAYEASELQNTRRKAYYHAVWDLADCLRRQKKWDDTLKYFSMVVRLSLEIYGREDPEYWHDQDELADVHSRNADWKHRLSLRSKAMDLAILKFGENSVQSIDAMVSVAQAHFKLFNFRAGEKLYNKIVPLQIKIGGENCAKSLRLRGNQAFSMGMVGFKKNNMKKRKEAMVLSERIYEATLKLQGPRHEDSRNACENLMWTYKMVGREKDAARLQNILDAEEEETMETGEEAERGSDEWETESDDEG